MSAQLARNIEVRAAAYVHSGVDSIRDIVQLLHRWGHHNDTLAVWGKLKCMLPQLAAINLQIAGVEVEAMILRENIFRATPTTLAPAIATVAPMLSLTLGATLSHTFSPSPGAYAKASPQERCAVATHLRGASAERCTLVTLKSPPTPTPAPTPEPSIAAPVSDCRGEPLFVSTASGSGEATSAPKTPAPKRLPEDSDTGGKGEMAGGPSLVESWGKGKDKGKDKGKCKGKGKGKGNGKGKPC